MFGRDRTKRDKSKTTCVDTTLEQSRKNEHYLKDKDHHCGNEQDRVDNPFIKNRFPRRRRLFDKMTVEK